VEIDSRKVKENNLFIPIIGERADGHDFKDQVKNKKAAAMLWQKDHVPYPEDFCILVVEDTQKALSILAREYLKQIKCKVIAITGSNGKTSCKDMMASVFSTTYKTHKTPGNRNNEIGLPLTILEMDEDTQVAVLEMGMENYGEIEALCKVAKPDIAVITSIGSAHMESFGSKANIARAKLEILDGLKEGGLFIYNGESQELADLLPQYNTQNKEMISFGKGKDIECISDIHTDTNGIRFAVSALCQPVKIASFGQFMASNALPVIAAAMHEGISQENIIKGLAEVEMTGMRSALKPCMQGWILDDTYKSNPESAMAAVDTLMQIPAKKHLAVLADMLDLGAESAALHTQTGLYALQKGADALYTYGPLSAHIQKESTAIRHFENKEELIAAILPWLKEENAVLIKGSRAMAMDQVVEKLLGGIENV
jgi:UDP-N-acetylmuramoyl-tripeptide--D-alanyl-D-alanine ligase